MHKRRWTSMNFWDLVLTNACKDGNKQLFEMCLEKEVGNIEKAVHDACQLHDQSFVETLLEKKIIGKECCFKMSCIAGNSNLARRMIEEGVEKVDGKKAKDFFEDYFGAEAMKERRIIYVRMSSRTIIIQISNQDRIVDIKFKIEEKERIPWDIQRLIFKGRQQNDDDHLGTVGIFPGTTLYLVLRQRTDPVFQVGLMCGREWVRYKYLKGISKNVSLEKFKEAIEEKEEYPADQLSLHFLVDNKIVLLKEEEERISMFELFRRHNFHEGRFDYVLFGFTGEWSFTSHSHFGEKTRQTVFLFLLCLKRIFGDKLKLPKPIFSIIVNLSLFPTKE